MALATPPPPSIEKEATDRIIYLENKYGYVDIHELYGMLRGQLNPSRLVDMLKTAGYSDIGGNGRFSRSPLATLGGLNSSQMQQMQQQMMSQLGSFAGSGMAMGGLAGALNTPYYQTVTVTPATGGGKTKPMRYKYKIGDLVKVIGNSSSSYDEHYIPLDTVCTVVEVESGYVYLKPVDEEVKLLSDSASIPQRLPYRWIEKTTVTPKPKITIDSVIIPEEKKEQIRMAISQVENTSKIFEEWGFSEVFEKGTAISLLFWGIPGTGKTLMAQAIADTLNLSLKIYGTGDIESSEPGGAERMIKQIFSEAKKATQKRLILFDECDSLLMDRNEVGAILGAQVNALLSEIERYEGVIIFTTNRLGKLDPALERRITTKIEFEFPSIEARKQIWERLIPKKAPLSQDVDLAKLAEYSIAGGNIKNAVLNAVRMAAYQKASALSMEHFTTTAKREVESVQAFMREYDDNVHQQQHGFVGRSDNGSLKLEKRKDKQIKIEKRLKFNQALGGEANE